MDQGIDFSRLLAVIEENKKKERTVKDIPACATGNSMKYLRKHVAYFNQADLNELAFQKRRFDIPLGFNLKTLLDPHWHFLIECLLWKDKIAMARLALWKVGHLYRSVSSKIVYRLDKKDNLWVREPVAELKDLHLLLVVSDLFDNAILLLTLLEKDAAANNDDKVIIDATIKKLCKVRLSATSKRQISEWTPLFIEGVRDLDFTPTLKPV